MILLSEKFEQIALVQFASELSQTLPIFYRYGFHFREIALPFLKCYKVKC